MGTINEIKSKLLELEGGAFQRLCDDWLFRKGYENINAIGMMQATDRVGEHKIPGANLCSPIWKVRVRPCPILSQLACYDYSITIVTTQRNSHSI